TSPRRPDRNRRAPTRTSTATPPATPSTGRPAWTPASRTSSATRTTTPAWRRTATRTRAGRGGPRGGPAAPVSVAGEASGPAGQCREVVRAEAEGGGDAVQQGRGGVVLGGEVAVAVGDLVVAPGEGAAGRVVQEHRRLEVGAAVGGRAVRPFDDRELGQPEQRGQHLVRVVLPGRPPHPPGGHGEQGGTVPGVQPPAGPAQAQRGVAGRGPALPDRVGDQRTVHVEEEQGAVRHRLLRGLRGPGRTPLPRWSRRRRRLDRP